MYVSAHLKSVLDRLQVPLKTEMLSCVSRFPKSRIGRQRHGPRAAIHMHHMHVAAVLGSSYRSCRAGLFGEGQHLYLTLKQAGLRQSKARRGKVVPALDAGFGEG